MSISEHLTNTTPEAEQASWKTHGKVHCSSGELGKSYLLIEWTPTGQLASWHWGAFKTRVVCEKEAQLVRKFLDGGNNPSKKWWHVFRNEAKITTAKANIFYTL